MAKCYITFGQIHTHLIGDKEFDKDTVAVFKANDYWSGRDRAFELFGRKFASFYYNSQWNESNIEYYPKGYIEI